MVTEDGMVVASEFSTDISEELVSALGSSIITNVKRSVEKMNKGLTTTILVETDKIKLFFHSLKKGFLVALGNNDSNVGLVRVELKNAAQRLDNLSLEAG